MVEQTELLRGTWSTSVASLRYGSKRVSQEFGILFQAWPLTGQDAGLNVILSQGHSLCSPGWPKICILPASAGIAVHATLPRQPLLFPQTLI